MLRKSKERGAIGAVLGREQYISLGGGGAVSSLDASVRFEGRNWLSRHVALRASISPRAEAQLTIDKACRSAKAENTVGAVSKAHLRDHNDLRHRERWWKGEPAYGPLCPRGTAAGFTHTLHAVTARLCGALPPDDAVLFPPPGLAKRRAVRNTGAVLPPDATPAKGRAA